MTRQKRSTKKTCLYFTQFKAEIADNSYSQNSDYKKGSEQLLHQLPKIVAAAISALGGKLNKSNA